MSRLPFLLCILATLAFSQVGPIPHSETSGAVAPEAGRQTAREQDAGTYVRKSFTVLPGIVGGCRGEGCRAIQSTAYSILSGDWLGSSSVKRFDQNLLPSSLLRRSAEHFWLGGGIGEGEAGLQKDLAKSLSRYLREKSLKRATTLQADYQKNSHVQIKTKSDDVTNVEMDMVMDSSYVALAQVWDMRVWTATKTIKRKKKPDTTIVVWVGAASKEAVLYRFDFKTQALEKVASYDESFEHDTTVSLSALANHFASFGLLGKVMERPEFGISSQVFSADGGLLRSTFEFKPNADFQLEPNQRLRYYETQQQPNGQNEQVEVGYGVIEEIRPDSTHSLLHIGGLSPYQGLVLKEPRTSIWATVGYSQVPVVLESGIPDLDLDNNRLHVDRIRVAHMLNGSLRFNTIYNTPHRFFGVDLNIGFGDASGSLDHFLNDTVALSREVQGFSALDLGCNWGVRYPIRRLALEVGLIGGVRVTALNLGSSQVTLWDEARQTRLQPSNRLLSRYTSEEYWDDKAEDPAKMEVYGGLMLGAQWSLSINHGIGIEVRWLLHSSDRWTFLINDPVSTSACMETSAGCQEDDTKEASYPSNDAGLGTMQVIFQWVFG